MFARGVERRSTRLADVSPSLPHTRLAEAGNIATLAVSSAGRPALCSSRSPSLPPLPALVWRQRAAKFECRRCLQLDIADAHRINGSRGCCNSLAAMPRADTKRIGALVRKSLPPIDRDTLFVPWMRGRNRRGTRNLDHGAPGTSLHVEVRLRGHELGVFCGEHLREKGCGCGGGGGSGIGAGVLAA